MVMETKTQEEPLARARRLYVWEDTYHAAMRVWHLEHTAGHESRWTKAKRAKIEKAQRALAMREKEAGEVFDSFLRGELEIVDGNLVDVPTGETVR